MSTVAKAIAFMCKKIMNITYSMFIKICFTGLGPVRLDSLGVCRGRLDVVLGDLACY